MVSISVTVIASMLSGIVSTFLTVWYYKKQEIRRRKLDLLSVILQHINCLTPSSDNIERKEVLAGCLNEAFVIFNSNKEITNLLEDMKISVTEVKLAKVIKLMCIELKLNCAKLSDEFITKPFTIK